MKKPGKDLYETPSTWRPIELLKTIGEVIEKVVTKRIREAAEAKNRLPPQQMGARAGRSIGIALELLTSMVRTIWREQKGQVTPLFHLIYQMPTATGCDYQTPRLPRLALELGEEPPSRAQHDITCK